MACTTTANIATGSMREATNAGGEQATEWHAGSSCNDAIQTTGDVPMADDAIETTRDVSMAVNVTTEVQGTPAGFVEVETTSNEDQRAGDYVDAQQTGDVDSGGSVEVARSTSDEDQSDGDYVDAQQTGDVDSGGSLEVAMSTSDEDQSDGDCVDAQQTGDVDSVGSLEVELSTFSEDQNDGDCVDAQQTGHVDSGGSVEVELSTSDEDQSDGDYVDAQQTGHVDPVGFIVGLPLYGNDLSAPSDGPPSSSPSGGTLPAPSDNDSDGLYVQRLRVLQKKQRRAWMKVEIRMLKAAEKNGFPEESDDDLLAIERARDVMLPDLYTGQSPQALDKFLRQVESTFRQKSLIYSTDEEKCVFAGDNLGGTPLFEWVELDKAIRANPERSHSWNGFVKLLQQNLIPKAQRELKLFERLKALKQGKNQSVGKFFSIYQTVEQKLEQLMEHDMPDWFSRMMIMAGVHSYLVEALMLRDRLGKTRLELEEALIEIEGVEPRPADITVQETYKVTRGASKNEKTSNRKRKSRSQRYCGKMPEIREVSRTRAFATLRLSSSGATSTNLKPTQHLPIITTLPVATNRQRSSVPTAFPFTHPPHNPPKSKRSLDRSSTISQYSFETARSEYQAA